VIPQKTVYEILETAKIEDVVGSFVNLKRRGVNLIGLCPFHNEKTPSFTVSPSKNICKCFGCGKGGSPVQFLMDHEQFTYPEALRYLADKYGIKIEEKVLTNEERQLLMQQDSLYIVNQFAKEFYQKQLKKDEGKAVGLSYFKERGFREATIEQFGLGFAPTKRDALTTAATQQGYNIDLLRQLGLTTKYDQDFFRERVMFTIHNLSGKPIAFAGRTLKKEKKIPKYINSPETDIYVKNKVLYGAYFAKQAIRKQDECILVEGYTDVISLHQAGIENVVASSGTSLTYGQVNLIKRYTPNIKILYDGDAAGVKAAMRGLDLVLEQDVNVRVVLLPSGKDPDSLIRELGTTAFENYINSEAKDFILFKTELLLKETENDPVKKTILIKNILSSLAHIPDRIKRDIYTKQCAIMLGVNEEYLYGEVNKILKTRINQDVVKRNRPKRSIDALMQPISDTAKKSEPAKATDEFQEKDIVRILVTLGDKLFDEEENISVAEFVLGNLEEVLSDFSNDTYKKLVRLAFDRLVAEEVVNPNFFINHAEEDIRKLALDMMTSPHEYSPGWEAREIFLRTQKMPEQNFTRDSVQSLQRFKLRKIVDMCAANMEKIKTEKDGNTIRQLLQIQQKLMAMRNELATELNTVVLG
jgi:DNA primase